MMFARCVARLLGGTMYHNAYRRVHWYLGWRIHLTFCLCLGGVLISNTVVHVVLHLVRRLADCVASFLQRVNNEVGIPDTQTIVLYLLMVMSKRLLALMKRKTCFNGTLVLYRTNNSIKQN